MARKKILVIEDDPDICEMLGIILSSNGFEVCLQESGKNAISQVLKIHPCAVIMDLWMPGIDGATATQRIKRNPKTKKTPVILVSAKNQLADIAKKSGADGFLAKPFSINQLLRMLETVTKEKALKKSH